MYRTALRSTYRPALSGARSTTIRSAPKRFASTTSPADKSRSWKSSVVRWGLAAGAVYYYTTSSVFSEELKPQRFSAAPSSFPEPETSLPTVESVIEDKRKQNEAKAEAEAAAQKKQQESSAKTESAGAQEGAAPGSPEALEEEADQQGAFNPETGEINWDCPCLGGMAHGPCGEEFKTAFSCFVYSTEEPKGMDCIDKFQGMQECFRKYPEIYGAELEGDQTDENGNPLMGDEEPSPDSQASAEGPTAPVTESKQAERTPTLEQRVQKSSDTTADKPAEKPVEKPTEKPAEKQPKASAESTGPKWEDATAANAEVEAQGKASQPKKE